MELFQILHKNIPQKNKICMLFDTNKQQEISKLLVKTIKTVKREIKDTKMINLFCIELYDIMYYSIIFHKIKVAKKILRLIEPLALPIDYIGEHKRNEILKKLCKIKI